MKGFEAVPALLDQAGLRAVFAMVGGSNAAWIAAGVQGGTLSLVRTRHEETAVSGAAGYARTTGSVGLCSVTRGPGFTNAINALTAATRGHVPIVLITGESPPTLKKTPQIVDQRGLTEVIGAGFHHAAQPDEVEGVFWSALRAVNWNGTPQVISLADGVVEGEVDLTGRAPTDLRPDDAPDPAAVLAAADALVGAENPLIVVGMGTALADCRAELEELADLVGARVATTLMSHRYFSGYPYDLGVCGTWSPAIVGEQLAQSDVVLVIGASLNHFTMAGGRVFGGAKIIQCEIDENQPLKASTAELALLGDAHCTVNALLKECRQRPQSAHRRRIAPPTKAEIRDSLRKLELGHDPARGLDPREVYIAFDDMLPPDRIVVTDHGRFQGSLISLVGARDAQSFVAPISYSSIGTGLGHAIGAAVAHPDRHVVLFAGDGGFMMAAQDLDTVRIADLNLTVVIINDEMYASDTKFLRAEGLPFDIIRQSMPDIPTLARAFGGTGQVLKTREELADLKLTGAGLTLLDVRTDPQVTGTPF